MPERRLPPKTRASKTGRRATVGPGGGFGRAMGARIRVLR